MKSKNILGTWSVVSSTRKNIPHNCKCVFHDNHKYELIIEERVAAKCDYNFSENDQAINLKYSIGSEYRLTVIKISNNPLVMVLEAPDGQRDTLQLESPKC